MVVIALAHAALVVQILAQIHVVAHVIQDARHTVPLDAKIPV